MGHKVRVMIKIETKLVRDKLKKCINKYFFLSDKPKAAEEDRFLGEF